MNILIVTPRIPYPPHRGDKLKIFNISKQLQKNHSVHIITFYRNNADLKLAEPIRAQGIAVTLVRLTIFNSILNFILAFFTKDPFQVSWYKSSNMRSEISNLLKKNKYDIIYYHLIRTAQFLLPESKNNINILDFTDAVSLYLSRMGKSENNYFKRIFIKSELKRINIYEKVAEKFDSLFVCSEIDKKFLVDKGLKIDINILKNGIDSDYFTGSEDHYDPKRIIFTGNMPYYANSDAAIYFSKEILHHLLNIDKEIKFYIVGQKPPYSIKKLRSSNIIVTGYVEDIRKEYLKSAVNVAPMRFGAGTLNKVIESIALGVPVVATSLAIMGLPSEFKKYIFVADTPKEFAKKILEIMDDKSIRSGLMKEGQRKILKELSWTSVVAEFENYLVKKTLQKKSINA